jgi:hypothetical protein
MGPPVPSGWVPIESLLRWYAVAAIEQGIAIQPHRSLDGIRTSEPFEGFERGGGYLPDRCRGGN